MDFIKINKKVPQAFENLQNEFNLLEKIHGDVPSLWGIQDKPRKVINLSEKIGQNSTGNDLNKRGKGLLITKCQSDLFDFLVAPAYKKSNSLTRFSICHQLLSGLGSIHDAGVVHGDLKPENILLKHFESSSKGISIPIVQIADFGAQSMLIEGKKRSPQSHYLT